MTIWLLISQLIWMKKFGKANSSYCKQAYELCSKLIHKVLMKRGETSVVDSDIDDVIYMLQNQKSPHYRLVLLFCKLVDSIICHLPLFTGSAYYS